MTSFLVIIIIALMFSWAHDFQPDLLVPRYLLLGITPLLFASVRRLIFYLTLVTIYLLYRFMTHIHLHLRPPYEFDDDT
jgi:hypothetical protein